MDFAGAGAWQFVDEVEVLWHLVFGQAGQEEVAQFFASGGWRRLDSGTSARLGLRNRHDDEGVADFAPPAIGCSDDGSLSHAWVVEEGGFHLGGVDVLASGDEHVLEPVDDEEETVGVEVPDVTGVEPAAGRERRIGGGLVVPVAAGDIGSADDDLTFDSGRTYVA